MRQHVPQPRARTQPVANDQVVEHAGPVEQRSGLKCARNAEARHLIGGQLCHVLAFEADASRTRQMGAADQIEEGGLTRAVRPDDCIDLAGFDMRADVVDRDETAEAFAERVDFKHDDLRVWVAIDAQHRRSSALPVSRAGSFSPYTNRRSHSAKRSPEK